MFFKTESLELYIRESKIPRMSNVAFVDNYVEMISALDTDSALYASCFYRISQRLQKLRRSGDIYRTRVAIYAVSKQFE